MMPNLYSMTHKVTFASLVVEEFANRILSALRLHGLLAVCTGKILKPAWFRSVRLSLVHLNFCHSLSTGLFLSHLAIMSDSDNESVYEGSVVDNETESQGAEQSASRPREAADAPDPATTNTPNAATTDTPNAATTDTPNAATTDTPNAATTVTPETWVLMFTSSGGHINTPFDRTSRHVPGSDEEESQPASVSVEPRTEHH